MKILHILDELSHSGAEVMLQLASAPFKAKGIESYILSAGHEPGEYAVTLQRSGYKICHISFRKNPGFVADVVSLMRRGRFKVVHIHTERAFIWYVLAAKLAGVPRVIRTFHGIFQFSGFLRWKRQFQRTMSSRFFRTLHTAISDSVRTFEKATFNNDCVLVENWTDVEKFRPATANERINARRLYKLRSDDFAVATIGGCAPVKNHPALFAAVKKANEQSPIKFVVLHVGTGPMVKEEAAVVQRLGMERQIHFLGALDDVRPCLYAADAFAMTSHGEGLGMAAIEAMSTGLPTILYNVYGLRDLVKDGRGGILIDPDEQSLVNALLLIGKRLELRTRLGDEAREVVATKYSLEKGVNKLIRLYGIGSCM